MRKRANGDGSIWQRADGRWCAAYYVPKPGGGRVRKYVYGRSREEVRRKLTELIRNVDQGVPVPVGGQTLADYLAEWLRQVEPLVRKSTYTAYESNVRLHIVPRIGRRKLDKFSARDVQLVLDDLRTNGRRPRLVQYVHATLRAALEHAVREELVARYVARLVKEHNNTTLKAGPGGHSGATLTSSAADLTPRVGTSDQPQPEPAPATLPGPQPTRHPPMTSPRPRS